MSHNFLHHLPTIHNPGANSSLISSEKGRKSQEGDNVTNMLLSIPHPVGTGHPVGNVCPSLMMYICGFFQYKIEKREESEEEEDDDDDDDDFGMNKKKEEEEMDPMMSEC